MEENGKKQARRRNIVLVAILVAMTIVLLVQCSGFLASVMASMVGGGIVALMLEPFTPGPPLFREENSLFRVNPYDDIDYSVPSFVVPSDYHPEVTGDSYLSPERRKRYNAF
jgi:hypothetical protein